MNARTNFTPETDAEARRERLLDEQLEMLGRLAQVGLQIAEAVGRQVAAMADAGPIASPDPDDAAAERRMARLNAAALAYGRAARAVRMTLALQAKLIKAPKAAAEESGGPITFSWMEDPAQARRTQAQRVQRIVRRVADDGARDSEALERLAGETAERLQDEDLYGDLLNRPVGEIIANICRDLGLDPDWARLAQEPWAQDEIEAGHRASPFAPFMTGWTGPPPPAPRPRPPPPA